MSGRRDVSIVIPNWNGRALLAEFLPSVIAAANYYRARSDARVEIIIVDDASADDSVSWLKEHYSQQVTVVARPENGGFSRAANSGFAVAQYPIIFLLNNDIRVEEAAIAPLAAHFHNEELFAVCCKAYRLGSDLFDGAGKLGCFQKGHWRIFLSYDILPTRLPGRRPPFHSFVASGGYSAFDAEKLKQLGGFCELLSPFYWEDADLCYRAWKRGWTIDYEPDSVVHHKSSATIGKSFRSRQVQIIAERNRLLMHWMNLHDRLWLMAHFCWLALKLLGALFTLDIALWRAFFAALGLLPAAWKIRNEERQQVKRSDREIAALFQSIAASDWAVVIRNQQEYYQYVELKRQLAVKAGATLEPN